jgi:hypothetical protein
MSKALRALLEGLIDYAGLFPPASLDMPDAAQIFNQACAGDHGWILGRFVVPAARIGETDPSWKISVIGVPPRWVESCEIKIDHATQAAAVLTGAPQGVTTYFEFPLREDPKPLAALGVRAKVRTGGLTPEAFPSSADLARFLHSCAAANVPFKATAGLHHPIRGGHPLTDEPDSPVATMHGFVNLFLAAALVWHRGSTEADALATLEEISPGAFRWTANCVTWHGHSLTASQISSARRKFAISFGCCSFDEPVRDLQELGWL